jgi:excinuclease ABC subunit C
MQARLAQIQKRLDLPQPPLRIECIDVSHTGGNDTVAAIVAFENGAPDRKRYRSFHVRNVSGGDDYGAMHEVLLRRFRRAKESGAGWELPNLLVVDGGKGQLAIALRALAEIGIAELPVAALAKEKPNTLGEQLVDRVYLPGRKNAIELREGGAALQILAHARDEAHRVSNALRVKLGKKHKLKSGLDDIPGVGRKTRLLLLKAFGSLDRVEQAGVEELIAAGATRPQAQAVFVHLHPAAAPAQPDVPPEISEERVESAELDAEAAEGEDDAVQNAFE